MSAALATSGMPTQACCGDFGFADILQRIAIFEPGIGGGGDVRQIGGPGVNARDQVGHRSRERQSREIAIASCADMSRLTRQDGDCRRQRLVVSAYVSPVPPDLVEQLERAGMA